MKPGIMLPIYRAYSEGEFEKIDAILAAGFSTLWLREWPSGIGVHGQRDHGSGHDPLIHAAQLAPRLTRTPEAVGFASLRLDYRLPMITARALVTCQYFSGAPVLAGLGAGTSSEGSIESASKDWAAMRSFFNTPPEEDTFILPPNFQPPKMYLASNNPELWKRIEYNAEGWLTYRIDPRRLVELATQIRKQTPLFFHRGRLFCGPLLHRQASLCPTCVALRLAQGFPHRDVLLSVMVNPVTSAYQTVLEDMWQTALVWIRQYEQQLSAGQMVSSGIEDAEDDLRFHHLIVPPGNHPHHDVQADYEPIFIGSRDAYNLTFSDSPAQSAGCIDKYVGPVLLTLSANEFAGEPARLKGYVTNVGHLGKYTKWSSDVTGAGMSFGAEAKWTSIGEAVERYSGNFIPDTLSIQSEHSLKQQSLSFLSQSLFRNLSAFQEDYYASKFAAISREESVMWANADPLTGNAEACLVPAEAAYLNLTRYTGNRSHFPVVLAGVAAHRSQVEAETSALLEVIERDATMCWWYSGVPASRIVNIDESINLRIEPTTPIEQWCLLLNSEFAYVVAGCLYDKTQQILTIGFAARHRVDVAILKSLAEAWQLRRLSLDLLDPASNLWTDIRRGKFPFPHLADL